MNCVVAECDRSGVEGWLREGECAGEEWARAGRVAESRDCSERRKQRLQAQRATKGVSLDGKGLSLDVRGQTKGGVEAYTINNRPRRWVTVLERPAFAVVALAITCLYFDVYLAGVFSMLRAVIHTATYCRLMALRLG